MKIWGIHSRLRLVAALLILTAMYFLPVDAAPAPPQIAAESAVLIDAATGKVLYSRQCRKRRPPASTTKIMTATLAVENGKLGDICTASANASSTPYGSLGLKTGETITLHDLLYAMMLRSANDGAVCVAEHISGTEADFVEAMNKKAQEIGAKDTHFANPHGLYAQGHYSTAYDLALIARYATRNPEFNSIVKTRTARINRSINKQDKYLINTAKILWRYNGADGIKTGYTKEAGHCFVGSATRGGWKLISVVMKTPNSGKDTQALFNYGFKNFKGITFARPNQVVRIVQVEGGVKETVAIVGADWLGSVSRRNAPVQAKSRIRIRRAVAPIEKGEKLGTITGIVNGREIGTVDLVAAESVGRTFAATVKHFTRSFFLACIIFLLGFMAYGTTVAKAARRRRRGIPQRRRKTDIRRTRIR
jgi:D-alanyl-D-alanine carboxypeptidase (penicillin-binding protein 5/6)